MELQDYKRVTEMAHKIAYGNATETPELVILDNLTYRLVKTTKRLTFEIISQTSDARATWYGADDGDYYNFTASNGYNVISRSIMDIQSERIWLLGASLEDRAERSGSMVFGSDERRDVAYESFHQALREWDTYISMMTGRYDD